MNSIIIFCAKYLIVIIVLMAVFAWVKTQPKHRREFLLVVIVAGVMAILLTKLAMALYFHPRPFVVQHIEPLVPHENDNGFPSRHTVLAMTLTTVIYYYRRQLAAVAACLTILVGSGRVLADVHSPIDILGGLVVGTASGVIGYKLAKRFIFFKSRQPVDHR